MKAVIAIDSFKGSLSTFESAEAAAEGIKRVYKDAETVVCPLADGGEGTVRAIIAATGGRLAYREVTGPLGKTVNAEYGVIDARGTAVIEMSAAAGITLVSESDRNPLYTTTYGVGELIRGAILEDGCRKFIIGIGGSATNDGGVGMLSALGFEFLDANGDAIPRGSIGLSRLAKIKADGAIPELSECEFNIACDVKNSLCGENGCSAVYGPQKGATKEMIREMDEWLHAYALLTKTVNPLADENYSGAGAAGGLGFAFLSYLGGRLTSGIELVIEETGLRDKLRNADIVITGEGRLDGQSCMGKAPIGVAKAAKEYGKTVIAFSGAVTDDAGLTNSHGIDAFFPIMRKPSSVEEAMNIENAKKNLANTAEQVFRLIKNIGGQENDT